jgi:hypothetical protein
MLQLAPQQQRTLELHGKPADKKAVVVQKILTQCQKPTRRPFVVVFPKKVMRKIAVNRMSPAANISSR